MSISIYFQRKEYTGVRPRHENAKPCPLHCTLVDHEHSSTMQNAYARVSRKRYTIQMPNPENHAIIKDHNMHRPLPRTKVNHMSWELQEAKRKMCRRGEGGSAANLPPWLHERKPSFRHSLCPFQMLKCPRRRQVDAYISIALVKSGTVVSMNFQPHEWYSTLNMSEMIVSAQSPDLQDRPYEACL